MIGGKRQCIAMAHKEAIKTGKTCIIAFSDNAVERSSLLFCRIICDLHSKTVKRVKMIAGNNSTAIQLLEIFKSLDFFDN